MPPDRRVRGVENRARVEAGLGGAEESLNTEKLAIAQHRLKRRNPGVGAQDEEAIIARFLGDLADVNLEGLLRGRAQVSAIGGVADERLVAPLELLIERRNDRGAVGGVLLRLGLVAGCDVADALDFDLLHEELRLAPSALDQNRRE